MDRNRDARRTAMATTNGLSRRRHRSSSLRDSPEDDGPVELQETSRLRDRKKDRDRDRDRERERDRDRDRDRDRLSRSKRRRGERLMHGSNRGEDGGDDTSEESVNDEDEDEDDDGGDGGGGSIRMLPPNPLTTSISSSLNHRKSFSPVHTLNNNKHFRPLTALKGTDEMIGVSVPRKARSASTKRSHEWPSSCGVVGGDQIHRQASTSPVRPSISAMAAPAPSSPSSSHASAVRKKLKPNGPKLRPPKMSSTKTTSSAQDEIEIEIAEVLYGMMRQPHVPSKQEVVATDSIKFESREANKSTSDAKSRVSSPISNSPCALPQPASAAAFPQNSSSSVTSMSAVAPKRKRPRPVKYDDENLSSFTVQNSPISSTAKAVADQPAKVESSSPNLEKIPGSVAENGGFPYDLSNSHTVQAPPEAQPEPIRPESKVASDSSPANDESESQYVKASKEEPQSPKKESTGLRLDDNRQALTVTRTNSTVPVIENQREEKYQFDLMALPERDGEVDFISVDPKPAVIVAETEIKPPMNREEDKVVKIGKEETANIETEKSKSVVAEESAAAATDFKKPINGNKERSIDLQLDLEKTDKDSGTAGFSASKVHQNVVKQQQQQQNTEKSVQSSSVPLPMSVAGWPGAIPPMGRYMAPLQGVVSMDGSTVSSAAIQPPHLLFNQPRPKRCATHCYIARNIYYHQQMSRMNPFWPMAPSSGGSLYGAKHCNPNVLPPELHGNIPGRGVNSAPDKGQGLAMFPGQTGKDKSSQSANLVDAQRKQLLLQQALPPGAPSNILHGPAFIFPMSQQQAAAAASGRPGSVKSPNAGGAVSSSAPNNASISATATAAAAPALSFNYPNMAANEPQYLAILQNNAYPFPMPAHVGAQTAYRGPHGQPMPYFNGSFYSSTMLHPSHLQQPQQQPPSQSQQSQQGHQNTTISSGSSSSQKHLQNQQQRPHPGVANGGSGSLQGFAASKNQSSQALQLQQQQQQQQQKQQQSTHVLRQHESEMGGEDSPSTADSRVSRANMNIYSQNFAMPMHPPNFALLTPPSIGSASGATGASGAEKKQQQQQQQGSKAGVDASQAFALSFAPINGATAASGIDLQSMNHAILQSFPDVTRQGYHQFMAAAAVAQAAQQKKSYRVTEEGKTGGGDPSNVEEERKAMSGKASSTVGHSIAFSRPDLTDAPGSTIAGNNVIDSSARTLNLSSTPVRVSNSVMPAAVSNVNAPTPQQQLQQMQQQMRNQQQQMIQLQKQQFSAAARSKTPATSNGSVYSDHLPSTSSMAAKFPNALSSFPQNLVQSSSSPAQSQSQWKNSSRTTTSQLPSSSLASSTSSTHKNLPQKHGRTQQSHTQISFAANTKSSSPSQGLQPASSNQSPSPPVMVGSPTTTTSSMSKSAGGSPRTTTSTSTGNKAGQPTSLSSQQTKNSPSGPTQKSSPVGGRNVPSILGNTGTKPQLQHQHQQHQQQQHQQHQLQQPQQQLSKQSIQQAQLFFSNAYMQTQASHSNNATSASPASGYYPIPRRRPDQQQQQQSQGSSGTSSSGMLSLCPVTHSNTSTNDPAKAAAAAAANNMKGGGLSSQTIMHAQFAAAQSSGPHQLVPAGFPYVHAVPTAVQVKPAEQKKQPAGE